MKDLRRTKQGRFNIDMANTLEEIENDKYNLYSISDSLNMKKIIVNDDIACKIRNGVVLDEYISNDKILFIGIDGSELAIYEKVSKEDRIVMKPWKVF